MLPDNLPHLCDITKSIPVRDEYLADIDEPDDFLLDEPCWVQPASDREINIFQRRDQIVTHTVYFKGDPGVRPGYIITPKNGPYVTCPFAGATFEVKSANETTAGLGLLWKVMVEEIQPR